MSGHSKASFLLPLRRRDATLLLMSTRSRITSAIAVWVTIITGTHLTLNVDWSVAHNERLPLDQRKLNVAYIPVT